MSQSLGAIFEGVDLTGQRQAAPWDGSQKQRAERPDATVRYGLKAPAAGCFGDIQAAIDAVVAEAKDGRDPLRQRLISIEPGFYEGPVVVPASAPPLVIAGSGPEATRIAAGIDAQMSGAEYAQTFRACIDRAGPQARDIFARITARQKIGTGNTAVLRICSDDVRLEGLSIANLYACDRASAAPEGAQPDAEGRFAKGQHQAAALMLDGADRVLVESCHLSSFQDTLYLRRDGVRPARAVFRGCEIEGDVDFIFGGATALFEGCGIQSRGLRGSKGWAVAPSTPLFSPYGFVFRDCDFTHDGAEAGRDAGCFLGRQWFEGVRATPYGTPQIEGYSCRLSDVNRWDGAGGEISRGTLESVGKCHLIGCDLGPHLDPLRLWDNWGGEGWSPRYRPVQTSMAHMLTYLKRWLPPDLAATYAALPEQAWLREGASAL